MKNLTSELVEEFRKQFVRDDGLMDKYVYEDCPTSESGVDIFTTAQKIEAFMLTAFDRVRAETKEECIDIVRKSRTIGEDYAVGVREETARGQAIVALLTSPLENTKDVLY